MERKILILSFLIMLTVSTAAAKEYTLFDWNEGKGTDMPGWTWKDDATGWNDSGWHKNPDPDGKFKEIFPSGRPLATFSSGGDKRSKAIIDKSDIAPSTDSGGSLKIYEPNGGLPVNGGGGLNTGSSNVYPESGWYLWFDGMGLGKRGLADADTNRIDFYVKATGVKASLTGKYGDQMPSYSMHFGTFLCWDRPDGIRSNRSGQGCPYEGPGNLHFYHYLGISPGAWVHVVLNSRPNHRRDTKITPLNEPVLESDGKHYMEYLSQFYLTIVNPIMTETQTIQVDELKLYSTKDTVMPEQNEESITSIWVGYWPDKGTWEMGWIDLAAPISQNKFTTFEIKWSLEPIKNDEDFAKAKNITPLEYSVDDHYLRRHRDSITFWTPFKLPDEVMNKDQKIYFAIKDISQMGKKYSKGYKAYIPDFRDAYKKLRIIDYALKIHNEPSNLIAK